VQLQLGEHRIDTTHRTAVMAIVNVSADSPVTRSVVAPQEAVARARALVVDGAEVVDVGAHSTRSGGEELPLDEEIGRVCPVIEALAAEGVPVSLDSWKPEVARAAARCGVHLLNDVTGLRDPAMVAVAVEHRLPVLAMHMRGEPTRHAEADQRYDDIVTEVTDELAARVSELEAAGVPAVWLDPGFGFGRSAEDNARLLAAIPGLLATGRPVAISASRKGFLGELVGVGYTQAAPELLGATVAFNVLAAAMGTHVVRVHDVAEVAQALRVVNAARAAASASGTPLALPGLEGTTAVAGAAGRGEAPAAG
jgi:dihydropteroate synthase